MEEITFLDIIVTIGVTSVIIGLIYIGRKLQVLDTLEVTSNRIKVNLNVVCNYLIKNHTEFNSSELQTFSPFQLTNAGKEFIKSIGFNNVFEKNKSDFFSFVDGENPKLKYDVENAAIKSIILMYNKDYMKFLKVYLYNHPERSIENIAPTLGVYVRDQYLKIHPEITE